MIAEQGKTRFVASPALILGLLLLLGLAIGYAVAPAVMAPPREQAFLWDDYILAVASIYQRDGDSAGARERLAKLPTEDPVRSVAALASVYAPESDLGESAAYAVRDLAGALTQRSFPAPDPSVARQSTAPSSASALGALTANKATWVTIALLSLAWITGSMALTRAEPHKRTGNSAREAHKTPLSQPRHPERSAPTAQTVAPPTRSHAVAPSVRPALVQFTYSGREDTVAAISPVFDPVTKRLVAGCGLNSGPRSDEGAEGFLGFAIWLHEGDADGDAHAVGLVTEWALKNYREKVEAWVQRAHLREVVVAGPGQVTQLATRSVTANVVVTEMGFTRVGRQTAVALGRLGIQLEIRVKSQNPQIQPVQRA
jgi:hypothetical protein